MHSLEFPDKHYVRAAEGWLDLGNTEEAAQELRLLSPAASNHPEALELRWRLFAQRKQWDAAFDIAVAVTRACPKNPIGWIHQSYCLHEMNRTQDAWDLLHPVAERFPEDVTVAYNLACYACRLGNLSQARRWIQRAIRLRNKKEICQLALKDPDLEELRPYIESL